MEPILRHTEATDWITGILLLGLLLLVLSKAVFYSRFMNFIILPFNNKYLLLYNKKGRLLSGFHIGLSVFQLLNLALFAYYALEVFYPGRAPEGITGYLLILGGIAGFTLLKVLLQLAGGVIFESEKDAASMVYSKTSYLNFAAFPLFLANLLLTYRVPGSKTLVLLGILLLILVLAVGWISVVKIHQKQIATHILYFILYLCALEIAPILIISGVLKA